MSLEQNINTEIKTAMLAKNEPALRGLRAIKAAVLLAKTSEGKNGELSEDDEMKLLQKLVKQRKDAIDIFSQQNREDLVQKEKEEIAVIENFLPAQMSDEELTVTLKTIITEVGAVSASDLGKVMSVASKQLAGKADGKMISTIVKQLLS